MVTRVVVVTSVVSLSLAIAACTPKPAVEELPPAGLAGAPGAPVAPVVPPGSSTHSTPQPSAALTSLPGMGHNVAPPSGANGAGFDNAQLPPGHPPIDTAPVAPLSGAPTGMATGPAATDAPQDVQLTGKVLEAIDVPSYTYMRLQTSGGEEWAAVNTTKVNVGDTVTVNSQLVMENFRSSSLNRTFPKLIMGMMVGAPKP